MRDPLIGTRINRYEIRESIHKSDVIGIYKAYDTKLERFVLIKTIVHSSDYSKDAVDYFLAESRTLARLAHPNIAKVLDFGYEHESLYLVSELVTGTPLSDLMNRPMRWQDAINLLLPLTNALIYAHSRGIIHRDLKPDNIIINTDDQPILSDFSLMRIIEEEETRDMTGTNVGLGSPEYISPEQGQGLSVDFRSDIYSLGVIFFEMVTGKKLFYATSSMEIVIQHIMADPPRPRSIVPDLPRPVEAVILNALSKDPGKRYQTMEDFSNAMKALVEAANREKGRSRRPTRLVTFSALGVGLLMLGLGFVFRNQIGLFTPSTPTATISAPTMTRTAVPASSTPLPATPTEAVAPLTPSTPANDSFAIYNLPALPVLPGTALPESSQPLDANNVSQIRELARWKTPEIRQLALVNGDRVILAATSAGLYLLDPADLTPRRFIDTGGSLVAFTVSDDGEVVATADESGTVAVWNLLDGSLIRQLTDEKYRPATIKSLDLSPDKKKLVFSDTQSRIHFWNLERNRYITFEGKLTSAANKVLFADGGDTVLSGDEDFLLTVWDAPSGAPGKQYSFVRSIYDMALSSDGRYLALALNEATLQIWDMTTGQEFNRINVPRNLKPFTFVTFLPNNTTVLAGSADGFIRAWNITGADPLWSITSTSQDDHHEAINPVKTAALSQDGTVLVVGFENGLVETWDLVTQKRILSRDLKSNPIQRVVISPNDKLVAIQDGDASVEIIALADDSQRSHIGGKLPQGDPISPDSQMISIQAGDIQLYSLSATAPQELYKFYDIPVFGSVAYSPDNLLFAVSDGVTFHYWSTASGRELKPHQRSRQGVCNTFYRRDDSLVVAGSVYGVMYSDANLQHFCSVRRNPRGTSEDNLPDGSIIALSLQNQLIEVWDVHKDTADHQIKVQTPGDVLDVAISADGKLLALASRSGTIEIYNLETLKYLKTLNLRTGPVHHVAFSHDGKYLVAGFADGTLRFFGLHP